MQTYGRCPSRSCAARARALGQRGHAYLDFLGGLAVTSLGHAHPAVADAIADQARTLLHVSNLYYNDVQPQVASASTRCSAAAGACSSPTRRRGQRVRDQARPPLRPGQRRPERFHVLSRTARSTAARSPRSRPPASRRSRRRSSRCRRASARSRSRLDALAAAMDERVCAVMLEPVQGEGGVQPRRPATSRRCARCATSAKRC
jgi:acetylornithine/succinyldiaminopimelate/putrescine aminotransferase